MDRDIEEVVPGHDKKRQARRERKPTRRGMQPGGIVPQRMACLEQHRDKRINDQPG